MVRLSSPYRSLLIIAGITIVILSIIISLSKIVFWYTAPTTEPVSQNNNKLELESNGIPIKLTPLGSKFRFIVEQGGDNTYPFVSWVETNTSLDLPNVAQQLESNGYTITALVPGQYLEALKTFYCFPDFCERYGCPQASVNGRVYANGTILFYTLVAPGSIAGIAYLDDDFDQMVPVTLKAVYEVLDILGLSSYRYYVLNSIVGFPDARYLVFLYPSRSWISFWNTGEIGFQGTYSVRSGAVVYSAGYLTIIKTTCAACRGQFQMKINDNEVARSPYVEGENALSHSTGSIDVNQYFQPSSSYEVVMRALYDTYGTYGYFVIAVIAR